LLQRRYTSLNALLAIAAVLACVTFTDRDAAASAANSRGQAEISQTQLSSSSIVHFGIVHQEHELARLRPVSITKFAELLNRAPKVWRVATTGSVARLEQIAITISSHCIELRGGISFAARPYRIRAPPQRFV
jgi:hypothetical protein